MHKSAQRVQECMVLYKAYKRVALEERVAGNRGAHRNQYCTSTDMVQFNYNLIEKSIKTYKTHCNAKDFDAKFVSKLKLDKVKFEFLKKVVTKMKSSF
jgi:hypothetical protein